MLIFLKTKYKRIHLKFIVLKPIYSFQIYIRATSKFSTIYIRLASVYIRWENEEIC